MNAKILIVDDDPDIVMMLEDRLQASGYETVVAAEGQQALDQIAHESPQLILLDLTLPKVPGLDVLKRLSQMKPSDNIPVIVMTAHASIEAAVEAMKEGAYDFLTKPLDGDHLLIVIRKALERDALRRQVAYLRSEVDGRYASIVGNSPSVRSVVEAAQRAAKSDASVLLLGESGTGKELFARSIHQWSHRCAMPLIVINCVALTETLLENKLVGHERGGLHGSRSAAKRASWEMADRGDRPSSTRFGKFVSSFCGPSSFLSLEEPGVFSASGGSKNGLREKFPIICGPQKRIFCKACKTGQFPRGISFFHPTSGP